jgi:hypothetical protein
LLLATVKFQISSTESEKKSKIQNPDSRKCQSNKATKYQMIENPKSKIPNPKQYQNPNDQNPKLVLKIGILEFVISLLPRLHNPFS